MVHRCCFLKIVLYLGLIVYHVADMYFDWRVYHEYMTSQSSSLIPKDTKTSGVLFLVSCITGTLLSLLLIVVYCYYIKYHRSYLASSRGWISDCNPRVVLMESVLVFMELVCKDGIQSTLCLIAYYNFNINTDCIEVSTKAFVACSVIANSKLLVCFATKLCGIGTGEEVGSLFKCLLCFLGCVGSLVFLFFTSLYFTKIQRASTCGTL